jgi:hypothetical protein
MPSVLMLSVLMALLMGLLECIHTRNLSSLCLRLDLQMDQRGYGEDFCTAIDEAAVRCSRVVLLRAMRTVGPI